MQVPNINPPICRFVYNFMYWFLKMNVIDLVYNLKLDYVLLLCLIGYMADLHHLIL